MKILKIKGGMTGGKPKSFLTLTINTKEIRKTRSTLETVHNYQLLLPGMESEGTIIEVIYFIFILLCIFDVLRSWVLVFVLRPMRLVLKLISWIWLVKFTLITWQTLGFYLQVFKSGSQFSRVFFIPCHTQQFLP